MRASRFSDEQIVAALRQAEAGTPVVDIVRRPGVTETTFSRWKRRFGDFRAGYTVAERPDLRILRDPFSAKPHVLFYATKRIGGDVSDFAAIKLLKFATA